MDWTPFKLFGRRVYVRRPPNPLGRSPYGEVSPPREPEPRIGALRIVPTGPDGYGVERYELKNEKSRHPYGMWERIFGHGEGASLEEAEAFARKELTTEALEAEAMRLHNAAIAAHHKANPPRIVTLDTLGVKP